MSAAVDAIWERMVELGESANDLIVAGQRDANAESAKQIAWRVGQLKTLADAVFILAAGDDDAG